MKEVCVNLGYFEQGDDFQSILDDKIVGAEAFREHALQMEGVALHLKAIAEMIDHYAVCADMIEFATDVHKIELSAPDALAKALVDAGLAEYTEGEKNNDSMGKTQEIS